MTNKTTKALKLAEEAMTSNMRLLGAKALAAIREELAEQDKHEPVAWAYEYGTDKSDAVNEIRWYPNLTALHKPKPEEGSLIRNVRPLYAAPVSAKREWVELTDDDINKCVYATFEDCPTSAERKLVSAVIAAFKEKNK